MAPERSSTTRSSRSSTTVSNYPPQQQHNRRLENGLIAVKYEETTPFHAPIPITVAPPLAPPNTIHPALRTRSWAAHELDDKKRDSGLAPTTSSRAREGSVNTVDENESANVLGITINFSSTSCNFMMAQPTPQSPLTPTSPISLTLPATPKTGKSNSISSRSRWRRNSFKRSFATPKTLPNPKDSVEVFSPITTPIPTDSLLDADFLDKLSFSNRGSIMLGGQKPTNNQMRQNPARRQPSISMLMTPSVRVLPDDVEKESQKVRSMYEQGTSLDWRDGSSTANGEDTGEDNVIDVPETSDGLLNPMVNGGFLRPESQVSVHGEVREHERAGGMEDWEDVNGKDVDRYGFISTRRSSRPGTPEPRPPQRVSTILQLASETPRQKRLFGRSTSAATSAKTGPTRNPNRKVSARSLNTQGSASSNRSTSRAQLRAAANRLPGNKDRRWMDEAGDMLTLPPGLADIAEDEEGGKAAEGMKKKEWERTEKWRKMAKVLKTGKDGEGMEFEFDTRNPKLIERTWKGIPDRWRSAAWHSFLTTSAKKRKNFVADEHIKAAFYRLQQESSADDVQIDIDVPRTINSHIMFRKRYRGGQRLLFRVLHALSLYFPDTGYVQGMASLAATLLCYYDEEMAFVMLTRMWTLRGLSKLYEHGFPGLMAALDEFQKQWMNGREVTRKLNEIGIEPTSYGTRWYLTLFNYSIPFPAQLRVWDVFMLLGDSDLNITPTPERPFAGGLDVLHATGAALIDGTREILLDSDFENGMKVLTSWIPVKDEELLMKVTKAEWKLHRGKKRR